ncbi:adipokinetic hormone/corazonin-related peptide receptor variant I-like [Lineus longissimus]|uniref:adipokinetic hormone/corazonin-related peptide receptor variant I-like n=1 Tax=Lineus longissimus TaxID=88925 RepID=UPI00315D186D
MTNDTSPNVTETTKEPEVILMENLTRAVQLYVPPVIIVLGVVGNILAYMVMRQPQYDRSSSSYFMKVLAILDTIILVVRYLQRYIYMVNPTLVWEKNQIATIFCKEFLFITFFFMNLTHWVLAVMAVDRLIGIMFPLKALVWCSVKRSRAYIIGLAIVFGVVHFPVWWKEYDDRRGTTLRTLCQISGIFAWYNDVNEDIYYFGGYFAPVLVLLVANIGIVISVKKSGRRRNTMTTNMQGYNQKQNDKERHILIMLMLVTWAFIFFLLPLVWDYFFWEVWKPLKLEGKVVAIRLSLYECLRVWQMFNHAANFYLYCLGCERFRRHLHRTLFGHCCQGQSSEVKTLKYVRSISGSLGKDVS